jgi:hypothetical protein
LSMPLASMVFEIFSERSARFAEKMVVTTGNLKVKIKIYLLCTGNLLK